MFSFILLFVEEFNFCFFVLNSLQSVKDVGRVEFVCETSFKCFNLFA